MHFKSDPLASLYVNLITEDSMNDFRSDEHDKQGRATNTVIAPGLHVMDIDEVYLKNGHILPGEAEFTAEWNDADHEKVDSRTYKTYDSGYTITLNRVYIPGYITQADLDSTTGTTGVYAPGMDLIPVLPPVEIKNINDRISDHFNDSSPQPK